MEETIAAISTAPGTAGIGIIRMSGKDVFSVLKKIFKPIKEESIEEIKGYTMKYGKIFNPETNEIVDEVLVSYFKEPKSYTQENMCEINSHGGTIVVRKILELCLKNGAQMAEPGEFTKRAFLNGRIDLLQAESVIDVINAKSEREAKNGIKQLEGFLSNEIAKIKQEIMDVMINIEVAIDYPEYEEGEKYTKESLKPLIDKVYSKINELLSNSKNGKIIKDGISVALVGKPNVGKSSILNALLEEEKAIVTNIPGTTRDIVEGKINLDGIILNIIDTAGIRKTNDIVEQIGVEKSLKMIGEADLIIYVLNNNEELTSEDLETINELQSKQSIIFINKNDLDNKIDLKRLSNYNIITGNTLNYEGLTNLKNEIKRLFNLNEIEQEDYTYLSNARQIALITKAKDMIENIYNNYENVPIDMFTIDLKNTYETLGEIIGATYKDDLLDELFSKFCLGK